MKASNQIYLKDLKLKTDILSENEILLFQELFYTTGFHYIQVDSFSQGRALVDTFISSIKYHKNIAYLTTQSKPLLKNSLFKAVDIYKELNKLNALYNFHNLEKFLLENFYYDFLWIELNFEILNSCWLGHFEQKIIDFNIDNTLPIIYLHI